MKHGKKYLESAKLVDRATLYEPAEALELAIKTSSAKFDETVEVHVRLGVDSRHADQQVRGAVVLPNGTGKKVRVAVFAKGEAADAAAAAGASVVHVDASKGIVAQAKENAALSGLESAPIRYIVDDCKKFVEREIRRGNK